MLVVTDVQDVFLPLPDGLLVSLGDCQATIEGLLHKLNTMFQSTQCTLSALGAAVQAALKLTVC